MALHPETRSISLCAGAGGIDLGCRLVDPGFRTVAYVEREAYAAANLVARMEGGELHPALVWSDLGTFDARPFRGRIHCITSGDPCQPNSVAGKRGGASDERFLIDQVLRVFDESGADTLFRENVPGNADGQLAAIIPPLEAMGCRVAAGIFSSRETGNSHGRKRLFLLAHRARGTGRIHARSRQSGSPAPDAGRGGGGMAHAGGYVQAWREPASGETGSGRAHDQSGGSGGTLDNAQLHRPAPGRGDNGRLADASGAHSQGRRGCLDAGGRQEQALHARLGGGAVDFAPIIIPGPADGRWQEIAERRPDLLPAHSRYDRFALALRNAGIAVDATAGGKAWRNGQEVHTPEFQEAVESFLRGGLDAMANRVDRLRLGGNGVDPVVAAYARICLGALLDA